MISKKLKTILLLTLGLIYLHGLEEIVSGFQFDDPWMVWFGNLFQTKAEVFYWSFHLMWWLLIPVSLLLIFGGRKWTYILLALFGSVYFVELHHPVKALLFGYYYAGMITGMLYPILGIFYWKELIRIWRNKVS